jgi:hypothetical protein
LGIVVFLRDGLTGSLENLMAVSEFTRGTSTRVLLALPGKAFTEFGLGENTLRLFRSRVERLGCALQVREMGEISPGWIRIPSCRHTAVAGGCRRIKRAPERYTIAFHKKETRRAGKGWQRRSAIRSGT